MARKGIWTVGGRSQPVSLLELSKSNRTVNGATSRCHIRSNALLRSIRGEHTRRSCFLSRKSLPSFHCFPFWIGDVLSDPDNTKNFIIIIIAHNEPSPQALHKVLGMLTRGDCFVYLSPWEDVFPFFSFFTLSPPSLAYSIV